jgi:hypothetical protein
MNLRKNNVILFVVRWDMKHDARANKALAGWREV